MLDKDQDFSKLVISDFFSSASSTEPVPGGGCVSAVCGYLAIGLLLKSIRISAKKQGADAAYTSVERQLVQASSELLILAQADSDSFGAYMQVFRLPKDTPEQITVRKQALNAALIKATESALDILDLGNQVLDLAHQVQFRVLPSIQTDEKSCVELISAMNTTAQGNASSNLPNIEGDPSLAKRLSDAMAKHSELLAACHSS